MNYEVILWEDKIERNATGEITHHPLNSRFSRNGKDYPSYGHLTFGGHDLDKSAILGDVRVYYLEFRGEPDETFFREAWADHLRGLVIQRLTDTNCSWYMSMIGGYRDPIEQAILRITGSHTPHVEVKSEKTYGRGYGFLDRVFYEMPNQHLVELTMYLWENAYHGWNIEGYNLTSGQIDLLTQWNERPHDDVLFREVIDQCFVCFYSHPAEHWSFVFVTNKVSLEEFADLIQLEDLAAQASRLSMYTLD